MRNTEIGTTRVLVVDDEPLVRRSARRLLAGEGYEVLTAATAAEGVAVFESSRPQVVVLDIKLPDESGLDLLPRLRKVDPSVQVIMITAYGEARDVVRAMKLGATDFLKKPYDLGELLHAVRSAARSFAREKQLKVYRKRERARYAREQMIGESPAMLRVKELVQKVARSDATNVLVTGESGTGKELVARAIHFESGRRKAPLIDINCSGFQENLLENELFGHERGAFTGANYLKRGLVELCDGGTLLLDEVADMPPQVQAKLLRFIDNKTFRRVGGNVDVSVDIRVIAATNADLEERISEKRFRRDLYFRLKVVSINLPPLRERGEDILLLATRFLDRFSHQFKKDFRLISNEAASLLCGYTWPGNVRELQNLLERVVLLEDGPELMVAHLAPNIQWRDIAHETSVAQLPTDVCEISEEMGLQRFCGDIGRSIGTGSMTLRELGDAYIRFVLEECGGNRSRAARVLSISRQGLIDRIRRMQREEDQDASYVAAYPRS
ncbi:MAG: sigma-54-dependent Fis family transcriptional regulator [Candidatus Eisenbacteria sp.]|nr:sigma-54-dependent Fis family transcriptional regulator [Candidatus Eisenbacteria bacterium]